MALIKCPECGKPVSDKAATCPNCGIDVQKAFMPYPQYCYQPDSVTLEPIIEKHKAPFGGVALAMSIISGMLLFLFCILTGTDKEESQTSQIFEICFPIGLVTGILGLVFSSKGLRKAKWNRQAIKSIAPLVVGKVVSIVSISMWGIYILCFLLGRA